MCLTWVREGLDSQLSGEGDKTSGVISVVSKFLVVHKSVRLEENLSEYLHEDILGEKKVSWAPLVARMVKNPPAVWDIQVRSLVWEDPLEKTVAVHSSTLAWRIPWTEAPGGLQS